MSYLLTFLLFLFPQSSDAFPPLGIIDFYGVHAVPEARLRDALRTTWTIPFRSVNLNHKNTAWNKNSPPSLAYLGLI